jgi:hypothetical protein
VDGDPRRLTDKFTSCCITEGTGTRANCRRVPALAALLLIHCAAATAGTWAISQKIPLGTQIVRILPDPQGTLVYAIDSKNSNLLCVDLPSGSVRKTLYVGEDPTDFDIDETGGVLYVANKGPGTGLPGSWRIGVVALTNQTLVNSYITSVDAVNVTSGKAGRLYYNSGFDYLNGGDVHALNTETGADLGSFGVIKTKMVIFTNKALLFGQYTYTGNLGAMGAFNVSDDTITLTDSIDYSPYPYGWDYDNYSLSGDNKFLAYGEILFNPTNFTDQIGQFPEQVYALNHDGSVAFGQTSIWDTTTFAAHGNATQIVPMPFSTTIMAFDDKQTVLYAFNTADQCLYSMEPCTQNGIPFRWLTSFGLGTNDAVESQDPDQDGFTNLQEWLLDSNPTIPTPAFLIQWIPAYDVMAGKTSPRRWYGLQRSATVGFGAGYTAYEAQGTGTNLVFDVTADVLVHQFPWAFYRLQPHVY